ncbi:MAG TPA: hypothetical protein VK324_01310 [Tepidisphaeraceae bacterium]|nr:hypothetical protein [Tepidisphaeraceae bacterium]
MSGTPSDSVSRVASASTGCGGVRLLCESAYITYPHCNGFFGRDVVVGSFAGDVGRLVAKSLDAAGGAGRELAAFEAAKPVWFDVAPSPAVAVAVAGGTVWLADLRGGRVPRALYRAQGGQRLSDLACITADGRRVVFTARDADSDHSRGVVVDTISGEATVVVEHDWHANHFHFCPHDEAWVGYCHEGATEVPDRLWAWHATHAPRGRCLFDQRANAADPSRPLYVGHERFGFARTSTYVVAYGVSPGGPRGLWEVFPDPGRPPRLVSGGDGDWHCDVSRDGRLAVVDTAGPHDLPGVGPVDGSAGSDIILIDTATGARRHLGRAKVLSHPYHPHPVFTPDGSAVLFNSATTGDHGRVRSAVHVVTLHER